MYTPNIHLRIDFDKEVDMFVTFLHSERFLQNRVSIFRCYPNLKAMLETDGINEKNVIRSFIEKEYTTHDTIIQTIMSNAKEKIDGFGKIILEQLSSLMDYTWSEKHTGYVVIPTILPFSPFNENTVYFSMARKIKGSKKKDDVNHEILPLLAHEISHLMYWDIAGESGRKEMFDNYQWVTKHFLQEILAPILMNQEPLKDILGIENYLGNPYLIHLNIEKNFISENIVDYFKKKYESMKYTDAKLFTEIMQTMASELESVNSALDEKFKMWNAHGHNIFLNEILLQKYKEPISV